MSQTTAVARCASRLVASFGVGALLVSSAGCLSIGGKTEVVASPETDMRVSSLESRVATLERTLGVSAVPPTMGSVDTKQR